MVTFVYIICTAIALLSGIMLLRAYKRSKYPLLKWSAYCFLGLTITNLLVIYDKLYIPDIDILWLRLGVSLLSLSFLLYGLILKSE